MRGHEHRTAVPPIRTATDLHRFWQELMHPLGFSERRLYVVFLDSDSRAIPELHEVTGLPSRPTPDGVDALVGMIGSVAGVGIALLLARPGDHPMDDDDRAWARGLLEASHRFDTVLEPLHFANDRSLVPFAGDDLIG